MYDDVYVMYDGCIGDVSVVMSDICGDLTLPAGT